MAHRDPTIQTDLNGNGIELEKIADCISQIV